MEGVPQLLVLGILGLLGGVLAGIVGVGGATIFIPALVYVAGWGIKDAVAASLMITVFSSISGTLRNAWSEDPSDWRVAALLASTMAPASLLGVFINNVAPKEVVQIAFAALLLALAYPTARGRRSLPMTCAEYRSTWCCWPGSPSVRSRDSWVLEEGV